VLKAYAKQPTADAPELVRILLNHMNGLSENYPSVKPDYNCHNVYIFALTEAVQEKRISVLDGLTLAEAYLEMMLKSDDDNMRPDKWSFNMVLSLISKSGAKDSVSRAKNLVRKLEEYHAETGFSEKTKPNANTYNTLMNCYARSTVPKKMSRTMEVMDKMKEIGAHDPSVQPDFVSYGIAMNLYAKSKRPDAPLKVEELLREMSEAYNRTGDWSMKPNRRSINACLGAYAQTEWKRSSITKSSHHFRFFATPSRRLGKEWLGGRR